MPFLIVQSDWKATNSPSTSTISPNTSNQNLEIASLLSVVDFLIEIMFLRRNFVLRRNTALRARVVSYALGSYKIFITSVVVKTLLRQRFRIF
jgi:hypothetical protein